MDYSEDNLQTGGDADLVETGVQARSGKRASSFRLAGATERYLDAARDQVRARPIAAAGAAFAIGFVLAIVTRSSPAPD
jgi:hypothetical protein